jgi:hypothetical protein
MTGEENLGSLEETDAMPHLHFRKLQLPLRKSKSFNQIFADFCLIRI